MQGPRTKLCRPHSPRWSATQSWERDPARLPALSPGEQHGFRKAETVVAALLAELSFYGQVLGFTPPGVPLLELTTTGG